MSSSVSLSIPQAAEDTPRTTIRNLSEEICPIPLTWVKPDFQFGLAAAPALGYHYDTKIPKDT
jgi:hypothetical protein